MGCLFVFVFDSDVLGMCFRLRIQVQISSHGPQLIAHAIVDGVNGASGDQLLPGPSDSEGVDLGFDGVM